MEEYLSLTIEEKISSVQSQIKSIQYSKYQGELFLGQEQSLTTIDYDRIDQIQKELDDLVIKEQFLLNELSNLELQRGTNV